MLLAFAGVVLSILFFRVPCEEKTTYEVTNSTAVVNVTTYENVTVYETFNTTVTVEVNFTERMPVDIMVALDASGSVSNNEWDDANEAGRALLAGFRSELNSSMTAGYSSWTNDGEVGIPLTDLPDEAAVAAYDIERQEQCFAVPGNQTSGTCSYYVDTSSGVWGLNIFTFYAQGLLACVDEYDARAQDGSFKLCIVVTDGQLSEDSYTQCVDGGALDTMEYTSSMVDDYYLVTDVYTNGGCTTTYNLDLWIAPGAYAFCQAHGLTSCNVDSMTDYMKDEMGIRILNVMVGSFGTDDKERMSELSSCDSTTFLGCSFLQEADDFDALEASAADIAQSVSTNVGTVTTTQSSSETVSSTELVTSQNAILTPTLVSDASVTQRDVCTGSGVSFFFMVLLLPLLGYLFLKPLMNCCERLCAEEELETREPSESVVDMHMNPVFGMNLDKNTDVDVEEGATYTRKKRGTISMALHKATRKKKKKHIDAAGAPRAPPPAASAPAAKPAQKRGSASGGVTFESGTNFAGGAKERGRASSVINNARRDTQTDWGSGIAAVYDGDDWQERVADVVIAVVCCHCRSDKSHSHQPDASKQNEML